MCKCLLGGVSALLTKPFYYYSYTAGLHEHMGQVSRAQIPVNSPPPTGDHSVLSDWGPSTPLASRASRHNEETLHSVCGNQVSVDKWHTGGQREVYCQHCT